MKGTRADDEYRWPRGGTATLLGVLILAAVVRLVPIHESLWLDELHTAWVVSGGVSEVAERAAIGNQSPLYFLVTWITTAALGLHEWTLRGPSFVAGLALVAGAFLVTLRWTNSLLAALAVGICAAIDRNFLFYATEARPYAMVQLLALVQLFVFWRLESRSTRLCRTAFITSSVGLIYLHYTAAILLLGEIGFHAAFRWRQRRATSNPVAYTFRQFAVDLFVIAICLLPAMPHVAGIGERRMDWSAFVFVKNPLLVPSWFSLPIYVLLPTVVIGLSWLNYKLGGSALLRDPQVKNHSATMGLIAIWFAAPVLTVWLATVAGIAPLYLLRYIVGVAVGPMLFAGLCIATCSSQVSRMVLTIAVVSLAFISSETSKLLQDGPAVVGRHQDWRSAVAWLNTQSDTQAPILVRGGFLEADRLPHDRSPLLRDYCLAPVNSIYRVTGRPERLVPLPNRQAWKLSTDTLSLITEHGSAWFLDAHSIESRESLQRRILQTFNEAGYDAEIVEAYDFGQVTTWQLRVALRPAQPPLIPAEAEIQ